MYAADENLASHAALRAASAQREAVFTRDSADANRASAMPGQLTAERARAVFGGDLSYLSDADRHLIHAATGEVLRDGQEAHERPLSAFAMQIAVDRRTGRLPRGAVIGEEYLLGTHDRLASLGLPTNPFTGPTLERALAFVRGHDGEGPTSRRA